MNANHYYKIGHDHTVCQDYALSGVSLNTAYAIVCDGCSSSHDVDFGARMLAFSALEMVRMALKTPITFDDFGKAAIRKADTVSAILPNLTSDALDATLLVAWIEGNKLTAYMFGDGVFFHKTAETIRAIHVEYTAQVEDRTIQVPAYLSYKLDPYRLEQYQEMDCKMEVQDCLITPTGISNSKLVQGPFYPVVVEAVVAPGDVIAVTSDGINSFRQPDGNAIDWTDMVGDFMRFKNHEGVFVERRMNALDRRCQRERITHLDDISLAAIVI